MGFFYGLVFNIHSPPGLQQPRLDKSDGQSKKLSIPQNSHSPLLHVFCFSVFVNHLGFGSKMLQVPIEVPKASIKTVPQRLILKGFQPAGSLRHGSAEGSHGKAQK